MIEYDEDWLLSLVFSTRGSSVYLRALSWAVPASIFSLIVVLVDEALPDMRSESGIFATDKSQLWSAATVTLFFLLGFRANAAYRRFWEGTSLLHQMRGEWFDAVSCLVTFTRPALTVHYEKVHDFRHTMVRLMSLCHGSALEEISGLDRGNLVTIDTLGLDNNTLKYLNACAEEHNFNRVEVLLHMMQTSIVKALDDGVITAAPPILSRVFQTLSRGFVNLLNCKKITDTRFPFPYAQLISTLLTVHMICTPIIMSALFEAEARYWAPLFTFVPVYGMHFINFISIELENPFGDDDNDLPLDHFQSEMNNCLIMLLQDQADLIPGIRKDCTKNFMLLKMKLEQEMSKFEDEEDGEKHHDHGTQADLRKTKTFEVDDEGTEDSNSPSRKSRKSISASVAADHEEDPPWDNEDTSAPPSLFNSEEADAAVAEQQVGQSRNLLVAEGATEWEKAIVDDMNSHSPPAGYMEIPVIPSPFPAGEKLSESSKDPEMGLANGSSGVANGIDGRLNGPGGMTSGETSLRLPLTPVRTPGEEWRSRGHVDQKSPQLTLSVDEAVIGAT
eukprot:TRINITY_DN2491_c1_g5_i1.p1 TRINITY_DN2491_c1_g5~~TRINITY_DN2491_c1_g5_i1.p1  ORF type:complete len:560 (-),score=74.21 TRINITY_DN2491_c1_g5_i1:244-1923(-)